VTGSLMQAPLYRFIQVIFHEDWQEQIDLPHGLEEPSAEVIGYTAALAFTRNRYGEESTVYRTLRKHLDNRLRESQVYREYYSRLEDLYTQYHEGKLSELDTLIRKARLLETMGKELYDIWGGRPDQLNNAFIGFQMTYLRHMPLMYEVYQATGADLAGTIDIFLSLTEQDKNYNTLEQVKEAEREAVDYLSRNL